MCVMVYTLQDRKLTKGKLIEGKSGELREELSPKLSWRCQYVVFFSRAERTLGNILKSKGWR